MPDEQQPTPKRSLIAVYRHETGDDEGNEKRYQASRKRFLAEIMKMHDVPSSETPSKKSNE